MLAKLGFPSASRCVVALPGCASEDLSLIADYVALAELHIRLVVNMISQRAWSMSFHSECAPDNFAGVLGGDADQRLKWMEM